MTEDYPNDSDGDALRRVAEGGADMSRPMEIEFTIDVLSVEAAQALAERIAAHGYSPKLFEDEQNGSISLYCARNMLATYEGVIAAQSELNELCEAYGATCDGWLTAGNMQEH